jgi:hypothetical protein
MKGKKLPFFDVEAQAPIGYARAIAEALRQEMNADDVSAKTIMRWTGASERAVKGWIGGKPGPSGEHLIALMAESDIVFLTVLRLARRDRSEHSPDLDTVRDYLRRALSALDALVPDGGPDNNAE